MDNHRLKDLILETLKTDERLWNEDKTELNQTKLLDLVEQVDETVIDLLLQQDDLRDRFFVKVREAYVFKTNDFRFFIQENTVNNSYTQYKNRIGLTDGERFLRDTNDVVLNFPYKDCILEGGQSSEEGTDIYFEYDEKVTAAQEKKGLNPQTYNQKSTSRKEIFFNSVLAQDEIDRLLDPKALVNWKRYTQNGAESPTTIKRHPDGTPAENMILKGNNLLALHSLKEQFAGKVKLIYIDPPYNTGNDEFNYNDNFNHSTWLTFMKNRLEVAKELLRDDGVIFVQCDDNEQAYLKVLMDDIQNLNYESLFHIKVRHENRILRQDNRYQKVIEHVLCYGKSNYSPNRVFNNKDKESNYQFNIQIKNKAQPSKVKISGYDVEIYKPQDYEIIKSKSGQFKEYNIRGSLITQKGSASEYYEKYLRQRKEKDGLGTLYKVIKMGEKGDGLGYRYIRHPFDKKSDNGFYYQGKPLTTSKDKGNPYANFYDFEKDFNTSSSEGDLNFKNGKKPEKFISKIFEIANVDSNDIILDFFMGSGTTTAVAHKMGRQYIGIEQMDYVEDIAVERQKKVIAGEQGGISQSVEWHGGGDFLYCELAKWNERAKEQIQECESLEELINFFDDMYDHYFLNYTLKVKEFKEKVIHEQTFRDLALEEQKKIFMAMLDNNQMYVNKTEMADKRYGISEEDQRLSDEFYEGKEYE